MFEDKTTREERVLGIKIGGFDIGGFDLNDSKEFAICKKMDRQIHEELKKSKKLGWRAFRGFIYFGIFVVLSFFSFFPLAVFIGTLVTLFMALSRMSKADIQLGIVKGMDKQGMWVSEDLAEIVSKRFAEQMRKEMEEERGKKVAKRKRAKMVVKRKPAKKAVKRGRPKKK